MSEPHMSKIRQPLTRLLEVIPGEPLRHENLTVFPLIADQQPDLPYLLLGDALDLGLVSIGEIGPGSVPSLQAVNRGDLDVLILDGEQLIGAKQNRITNRTIILQAKTETVIPVSCMEQGRWHHVSPEFRHRAKPRHAPPRVRRKAREVEANFAEAPAMAGVGVLHQAQGEVWREIADVSASMGVRSDTSAMDEVYDRHSESVDEWIAEFPCRDDQVGLVAFLGRRPLGLDVVGGHALYGRLHDRFLGGYVMDALARRRRREGEPEEGRGHGVEPERARRFLSIVGSARRGEAPTVGKGTYHLIAGRAIGAELSDVVGSHERLVHLSAFPAGRSNASDGREGEPGNTTYGPIASPSRRRGWAAGRGQDDT